MTCYFIDTAKNIVEYLEVIYDALKYVDLQVLPYSLFKSFIFFRPGGVWINLGPLLYHFEGMRKESSIDLSLEEVKSVSRSLGFVFEVISFVKFV